MTAVLGMEWTKLRSVRSTYWTLLFAIAATIGISALICSLYINRYAQLSPADRFEFNATRFSLNGLELAQLAIGVLGALVITNEYSTGVIRATLSAVPQRPSVLAAKALVFGAVILVVGEAASFAAFFLGQSILSSRHIEAHLGDPGVLRAVIGGGLYLTVLGLFALGIGTMIRHTAGAIATLFGLLLVLPGIVAALPLSWQNAIEKWLPANAGQAIFRNGHGGFAGIHQLSPWAGLGIFCAYAAASLILGGVLLVRRDA
ncbi:MAG TPA: ABC transporter permease [Acidimicrobiales bacterium]|nr:ABC transporter permease [Acidimicrobiales bacterium]